MSSPKLVLSGVALAGVILLSAAAFLLADGGSNPSNGRSQSLSTPQEPLEEPSSEDVNPGGSSSAPDDRADRKDVRVEPHTQKKSVVDVVRTQLQIGGRVETPFGEPLAGVQISVRVGTPFGPQDSRTYEATSEPDGRFSVKVASEEAGILEASLAGYVKASIFGVYPGDEVICVMEPGTYLEGVVLDAESGTPIGEALVTTRRGVLASKAKSDPAGRFRLDGLSAGTATLDVAAIGYERKRFENIAIDVDRDRPAVLELELVPGSALSGVVFDAETASPIPGAKVEYILMRERSRWGIAANPYDELPPLVRHTDPHGVFAFEKVGRDNATLRIEADGYVSLEHALTQAEDEAPIVEIRLAKAWALAGRVLTPNGDPAEGAEVQNRRGRSGGARTRTDAKGRFTLSALDPQKPLSLIARHPEWAAVEHGPVEANTKEEVVITLGAPGMITGVVVGPDGQPVPEAKVRLRSRGRVSRLAGPLPTKLSDPYGRFEFLGLPEGRFELTARSDSMVGEPFTVDLEEGQHEDVSLSVVPGLAVSGQVVDGTGRPLGGVRIGAAESESDEGRRQADRERNARLGERLRERMGNVGRNRRSGIRFTGARTWTYTDENGRFMVSGFTNGALVRLTATRRDIVTTREEVPAGSQNVVLRVVSYGAIRGRVEDATTRRPVERFRIEIVREDPDAGDTSQGSEDRRRQQRGSNAERRQNFVTADGAFTVERLVPGDYRMRAVSESHRNGEWVKAHVSARGPVEDVNLSLIPGSVIAGVVKGRNGKTVSKIPLFLNWVSQEGEAREPGNRARRGLKRSTTTNDEGRYTFRNLRPGTWSLGVGRVERPALGPFEVEVAQGQTVEHDLRLPVLGSLEATVQDMSGQPLARCTVRATLRTGRGDRVRVSGRTDREGKVTLENLVPGTYSVSAQSRGKQTQSVQLEVSSGRTASQRFALEPRRRR